MVSPLIKIKLSKIHRTDDVSIKISLKYVGTFFLTYTAVRQTLFFVHGCDVHQQAHQH